MEQFSVIVANVGTVLETTSEEEAWTRFSEERTRSRFEESARSFLEPVSLLRGTEVLAEWTPPTDEDAERLWADEDGTPVPSVLDFLGGSFRGGEVYELARYKDSEEFEDGGSASFRDLDSIPSKWDLGEAVREDRLLVYVPPVCSGSDYSGGALARANVQALEELADSEGIVHWILQGGHGSHGIAFPLWERSASLLEALEGLDGYPVVDEDTLSEVEQKDEKEAWECWIRADYASALETETGVDVSDVSDEDLRTRFYEDCERTGSYVEHGEETWIDLERVTEGAERAEVLELAGAVSSTADEEKRAQDIFRACGAGYLARFEDADARPALVDWTERAEDLRELRVLDLEENPGASLVEVLREVADYPLPSPESPLPKGEEALSAELARLRKDLRTIRDGARGAVLPVLESWPDSEYGREGRARAWTRDERSGLLVLEHLRKETESAWTDYVRAKQGRRARTRTILLPRAVEDALSEALERGYSARDVLRSYVLDRIAAECERRKGDGTGSGVLTSSAGGWSTVLEVDREGARVRIQDRREGREPEWRKLEDFESMVSDSF